MKAIVNTARGQLEWREVPLPQPGAGQVRIRVAACGICATDLEMIAGWPRTGFPSIPGHEWAGIVHEVGEGVDLSLAGKRCVAENVIRGGGEVGFEHAGGYAQYLITDAANVYGLPGTFDLTTAVLIEPLAVCVRALNRLRRRPDESAIIFGDGPIGLLTLILLRHYGAQDVVLIGGCRERLSLAAELGATRTLDFRESTAPTAASIAQGLGKPLRNIIEASGSEAALRTALDIAPRQSRLLLVGDYKESKASFRWNQILHGELELIGSNASAGAWPEAVRLAVTDALPLQRLISRCLPAESFAEAMLLARARTHVKVVLRWDEVGGA
jgi:L-gulonate 5-dehydrogenase